MALWRNHASFLSNCSTHSALVCVFLGVWLLYIVWVCGYVGVCVCVCVCARVGTYGPFSQKAGSRCPQLGWELPEVRDLLLVLDHHPTPDPRTRVYLEKALMINRLPLGTEVI